MKTWKIVFFLCYECGVLKWKKKTVLLYSKRKKKKSIHKLKNVFVSCLINVLFVMLCGSVIFKKERVSATGQRKIIYVSFF